MTYSTSATRWNHGIQERREGCAEGKAAPGAGLEGAPIESVKKKYRITVLWNKVGVFLGKIVVH